MCECLKITYQYIDQPETTITVETNGTFNGFNTWEFTIGLDTFTIWHDAFDQWNVTTDGVGGIAIVTFLKNNVNECPLGSMPTWGASLYFNVFTTSEGVCNTPCDCVKVFYKFKPMSTFEEEQINPLGLINGYNYYEFDWSGFTFRIYYNLSVSSWVMAEISDLDTFYATNNSTSPCPYDGWIPNIEFGIDLFQIVGCDDCLIQEDRDFRRYDSIRLPEIFEEEDRGYFRCCCPFNVLASNSSDSWKNDITSAWIKLSGPTDTVLCFLEKNGQPTTYVTIPVAFLNEPNAFYWTINWFDVLTSDGAGCYEIKISYNIAGIEQVFTWGVYHLALFTVKSALNSARLRVKFNSNQEIEGINFSGSQVEDTIRFYGFIGNRQPNTETDNIIYQNREMKKVIRENLNKYEIVTEPTCEEHIRKLTDLYLLSENEMYISDYNAHNHSYRYNDLPVILEETAEITYFDFSRSASLKAIVSDKFKNKRSFY